MFKRCAGAAFVLFLLTGEVLGQFAGGSGTASNPFQIAEAKHLQEMQNHPDKHFVLLNDIDASETKNWNDGKGFIPIGKKRPFTGEFNGAGFTIQNLYINRDDESYTGIFSYVDGGTIKNLSIKNAGVIGADNSGILAGFSLNGRLFHVTVSGKLQGKTHVGGLVGFNYGKIKNAKIDAEISGYSYIGGLVGFNRGEVDSSSAGGVISGEGNGVGGLVGNNYDGTISHSFASAKVSGSTATSFGGLVGSNGGLITKSYAEGNVYGRSYVGGLTGFNRGKISEVYSTGEVFGTRNGIGGLIGNNFEGNVEQAYSEGKVTGGTQVGGLIGVNRSKAIVKESYSLSTVSGKNDTGGLIGLNENAVESCYWNTNLSGHQSGIGRGISDGITGLKTDEMKGFEAENKMKGFSFKNSWGLFEEDYPKLLWSRPYYLISDIAGSEFIVSGDVLDLKVKVRNIGGKSDTNQVVLKDTKGKIIYTSELLMLASNEEAILEFGWQSKETDNGDYEFILQSGHDYERVRTSVRLIPDVVEIVRPVNLDEHLPLNPEFVWKSAYLADKYQLQIATDPKFENIILNKKGIGGNQFKISKSLNYLSEYYWRVRGINSEEKGEWSEILTFTTVMEKPEAVQLREPTEETEYVSTFPLLKWSETERADEYLLQLSKEDDFESVEFDTTFSAIDTSYTIEKELLDETVYYWRVQAKNDGGNGSWSETGSFLTKRIKKIDEDEIPVDFTLKQNYPNPFNSSTVIQFGLPTSSEVLLEVLNMLGQNVVTLVNSPKSAGWHTVNFDASELSSGFYLYRLKTREYEQTKKFMIIK